MGSKGFSNLLEDLCCRYRTNLFIPFETHGSGPRAQRLITKFGFDGDYVMAFLVASGSFGRNPIRI